MDLGLAGKVALVAGGSSGLGLAIAKELASEGARVSIAARNPQRLAEALAQLPGEGHLSRQVDVTDPAAVRRWIDDTVAECGALHILVANAGGPPAGRATAFAVEDYRKALEVNMLSQIGLVQTALPHLQAAGWGRILFITGRSVKTPQLNLALSNTSRVGVVAYMKSLVADLGAQNITVNTLAPGSHDTPRLRELSGGKPPSADDIPLGRVGSPEEFAAAAAFLASERAGYITGVVLQIDGGAVDSLL